MEAVERTRPITVPEYLKCEAAGQERHEYISGSIYAMAGASERHNIIAGNIFNLLSNHLRNGPCRAYIADFKVRLEVNREDIFYYPDVMVGCVRDGVEEYYLRYPKLVIEVLSPSTEATDRREKLINYTQIPTLDEYVIVAQDTKEVLLHRRHEGWKPNLVNTADALLRFDSLKLSLPLGQIYEGVS